MQDLQRSESSQSTPNLLEGEFNEDIEIWDRRTKSIYISIPTHAWHITHQLIKNLIALLSQLWCLHRIPSITKRLLITEIGLSIKGTHFYGYLHDYCCQIGWFWFTSLLIQQQKYMERANWRAYVATIKLVSTWCHTPIELAFLSMSDFPDSSVAAAIADVFRKNGINVRNKFVRILKIFTKINDLKNRRVI